MKKFLLLSLVSLVGLASVANAYTPNRAEYVTRVESCEAILEEFQSRPETAIPREVLQAAKGLVILNQFKAGFIFGVKDGYGVILTRKSDGRWSLPVLIKAGEASLGLQVGASSVTTILVLTNNETAPLLFKSRFNIGADAKAVAGPKSAETERFSAEILRTPVLVYTKSAGLFAGATVKSGWISRNDDANFILYGTKYTMPELLYSDWVTPPEEVRPLMGLVQKIAP